jgi:hypothetical protein
MSDAKVRLRSGPWSTDVATGFLTASVIPIRLATQGAAHPMVQSLWFDFDGSSLWCCTKDDSVLARRLAREPRCAFEVSADMAPYRGVRGTGTATLMPVLARDVLPRLIDRYGQRDTALADWLLSRLDREVAIRIDDLVMSSWDYAARMATE